VREWTLADLLPDVERSAPGRDFARGRKAFADAQCLSCHRMGNDGGTVGPELTGAGSKYDARSLLESILEPSKVVADQYQNTIVITKNGDSIIGRVIDAGSNIAIETDPLSGARETIARSEIERMHSSTLSPMPEGLLNTLSREEILDLVAYLQAGGRDKAEGEFSHDHQSHPRFGSSQGVSP
jgi:putative heme-binding domain-containing protein